MFEASRDSREWLEADGLGGGASGTVDGIRTRRYHALLLTATTPPTGRVVLVSGFDAWVDTPEGSFALTSQFYEPGVIHPDGYKRVREFHLDPWPRWIFELEDGTRVQQELLARRGSNQIVLTWRLCLPREGAVLRVRPFLACRDYHSMHHQNGAFWFGGISEGETVSWRPYVDLPEVAATTNGTFRSGADWYRNFRYEEERLRGLDYLEDLASPGEFTFELGRDEAVMILESRSAEPTVPQAGAASALAQLIREDEAIRRAAIDDPLDRAAEAYIVRRGNGQTIAAGYPWFTDWGRDTFIALRGLCLATGRLETARSILLEWAGAVSEGMLPNRFQDHGEEPEYNSVDASLWYVIVAHEYLEAMERAGTEISSEDEARLHEAVNAILGGYRNGTRHGIRMDADGLLSAGTPGVQLTWMDAKIGDWVVTPRIGKPVEVQALWLNALALAGREEPEWMRLYERARPAFVSRFWNAAAGCLYDVIDVDHQPGEVDGSLRPNQIFAVGGLPIQLVDSDLARSIVDAVEWVLLTPLGLRTLSPRDPNYRPVYAGGVLERDSAYHQGTVWPWLLGPFVEAWLRVHGDNETNRRIARRRFLCPLFAHLDDAGLGHVSEVVDGAGPHKPGGCPFQAWSLGELIRIDRRLAAQVPAVPTPNRELAMETAR